MAQSRSAWATPAPLRLLTGVLSRVPLALDSAAQGTKTVVSCRTASKQQSAIALVRPSEPTNLLIWQSSANRAAILCTAWQSTSDARQQAKTADGARRQSLLACPYLEALLLPCCAPSPSPPGTALQGSVTVPRTTAVDWSTHAPVVQVQAHQEAVLEPSQLVRKCALSCSQDAKRGAVAHCLAQAVRTGLVCAVRPDGRGSLAGVEQGRVDSQQVPPVGIRCAGGPRAEPSL